MDWTQQEMSQMVLLARARTPYKEIAKRLNRSPAAVKTQFRRYRESLDPEISESLRYTTIEDYEERKHQAQKLRSCGTPVSEIIAITGMRETWVYKWTKRPPNRTEPWRDWGKEERNAVVDKANLLRDRGLSCEEIGKVFGFSDTWGAKWTNRRLGRTPERKYALHAICIAYAITGDMGRSFRAVQESDIVARYTEQIKDIGGDCHNYRLNAICPDRSHRRA